MFAAKKSAGYGEHCVFDEKLHVCVPTWVYETKSW
jgi:hypothetical protein